MKRNLLYESNPERFVRLFEKDERALRDVILTARDLLPQVTMEDFTVAIERIVAGLQRDMPLEGETRKKVAYHESGHALVSQLLPLTDTVHKVSIIPTSKGALGYTMEMPEEDRYLMSKPALEQRMAVMLGGRAAELLAANVEATQWDQFTECPWEDLRNPGRVHVDSFGHLHICQGISIGNMLEHSLAEIIAGYDPDAHPIVGPLLAGGPAEIVHRYQLPHLDAYADHCHLCYASRCTLRPRFPDILAPDQVYGTSRIGPETGT